MPVPPGLRRKVGAGFALRGRGGASVTTSPRAMTMTSRRAADSAGLSRRRIARWRWRGRVGAGEKHPSPGSANASASPRRAEPSSPARGEVRLASPAMATSMATMRPSAAWFLSIARFQSIAVPPCRDFSLGLGGGEKGGGEFFRGRPLSLPLPLLLSSSSGLTSGIHAGALNMCAGGAEKRPFCAGVRPACHGHGS